MLALQANRTERLEAVHVSKCFHLEQLVGRLCENALRWCLERCFWPRRRRFKAVCCQFRQESPYDDAEDMGQCLSMHQPWASLLVHGFKRAEGRSPLG